MNSIKSSTENYLNLEYGKTLKTATIPQIYNAVSRAIMASINCNWQSQEDEKLQEKRAYYLSAEFLIGRQINNNLLNLNIKEEVDEILNDIQQSSAMFEEIEDNALGNGGLGRLAACFLESGATTKINLDGYGIRYKYGLFKQSFQNNFQVENADDWQRFGDPWSYRKESEKVLVSFSNQKVFAVPYDLPVIGYQNGKINTLRLWQSEAVSEFDFDEFNKMNYADSVEEKNKAELLSMCLYPNDESLEGKELRLKQQYFFCSASLSDMLAKNKGSIEDFANNVSVQLNDTHPTIAIPELIRQLMLKDFSFEQAFEISKKVFAFTNHTILGEALEKWDQTLMKNLLPQVYAIIEKIDALLKEELTAMGANELSCYEILNGGVVHMARLAIFVGKKTNGVAKLHTDILMEDVFKEWYELFPQKFTNVTNGITPRRWLFLANEKLTTLIESEIGSEFKQDLTKLEHLLPLAKNKEFIEKFKSQKEESKQRLCDYIYKKEGIKLDSQMIFDIQIKRMHEYKRQIMNAFSILYIYNGIKDGSIKNFKKTTFIFGGKSAPGYYTAKTIIKFINDIATLIEQDKEVSKLIKVVFVSNYDVSYAEKLFSGADVSEQISTAGYEASGTGNMKFMLNGTVTLGTLDGANVEIVSEAGGENNYIFGATKDEVNSLRGTYNPKEIYKKDKRIKKVVDTLIDGTFSDEKTGRYTALYNDIINKDFFFVLHDLNSYVQSKLQINKEYGTDAFFTKCIVNMAKGGTFSSDRSILEYADKIWQL